MASVAIGPLTLHTNDIGWLPTQASSFAQGKVHGRAYPAVVTGPGGLELDIEIFVSDAGEGMVHSPDPAGVPVDYARLGHGARLGVYQHDETTWVIKQLRLLAFTPSTGWGNPRRTSLEELDGLLGSSVEVLLSDHGLTEIGPKEEVLGSRGQDIVALWPADSGPELPLACYTLTRVLPIFRAMNP